jgi:hypothetical protein
MGELKIVSRLFRLPVTLVGWILWHCKPSIWSGSLLFIRECLLRKAHHNAVVQLWLHLNSFYDVRCSVSQVGILLIVVCTWNAVAKDHSTRSCNTLCGSFAHFPMELQRTINALVTICSPSVCQQMHKNMLYVASAVLLACQRYKRDERRMLTVRFWQQTSRAVLLRLHMHFEVFDTAI